MKKIDRKKLFCYITIGVFGSVIDITLNYFKINLTYSFGVLFINLLLYSMWINDEKKLKKSWELIVKFFAFILIPILFSFLTN